jgi:hypothetical protein
MQAKQSVELSEYTFGKLLGKGAFAKVFEATKRSTTGVKGKTYTG